MPIRDNFATQSIEASDKMAAGAAGSGAGAPGTLPESFELLLDFPNDAVRR